MTARVRAVAQAVRFGDWWGVKVGPLLGLALVEVQVEGVPAADALVETALVMACGAALAAYGHVVNDVADRSVDAAAGKPNVAAGWPRWAQVSVPVGLLVVAFGMWGAHPLPPAGVAILAANAMALALYALPPVRLKERAALGVAADAAYAHVLPTLFVLVVYQGSAGPSAWHGAWVASLGVWAAAYGVRGVVLHQLRDLDADRRAGVTTFAVVAGPEQARRWGRRAYAVEVVAAGAAVAVLFTRAPMVSAALTAIAVLTAVAKVRGWGRVPQSFDPLPEMPGARVPLTHAYAVWPAVVAGAALVVVGAEYVPLVAAVAVALVGPAVVVAGDWTGWLPGVARSPLRRLWNRLTGHGRG